MTFQEFQKLELGTKLRLKGTNAYFEVADIDIGDSKVPLSVTLVETDKPVFVSYDTDWNHKEIIEIDANDEYYEPEYWIYANKTVMREEAELTRTQFEKMTEDYYIITMRDLEVVEAVEDIITMRDLEVVEVEEDIGARLDEHIDPRDLIYRPISQRGSSPAKPVEDDTESGVLPATAARQFVNNFNSRKVTIQLINAAIARAAQDGKQVINLADVIDHQVSEEIKDLYRQAGYHVAFETIQW